MPLSINTVPDEWLREPSSAILHRPHPHPLRSHSAESVTTLKTCASKTQDQQSDSSFSNRPDSCVLTNSPYNHRRSVHTIGSSRDSFYVLPLLPQQPTFRAPQSAPPEGFFDVTMSSVGDEKIPVVATRPPLRPTVSFGSVSRYSYYSDMSVMSGTTLDQKSEAIAAAEELALQRRVQQARPPPEPLGWTFYASFATLCLLSLLCGLSTTTIATSLPTIAQDLSIGAVQAFWLITSFVLTSTVSQPLLTRLAAAIDAKALLIISLLVFASGSTASALGTTYAAVLAGRCLEGIGTGGVMTLSHFVLHQLTRGQPSARSERVVSLVYWLGAAIGPVIGAAATSSVGWRYIFWIHLPLAIIGILTIPFVLRLPLPQGSIWTKFQPIDCLAFVLLTGPLVSVVIAISWGGTLHAWSSWRTLLPLILGLTGLVFWIQYSRYRTDPIVPVYILHRASALVSYFGIMVLNMLYISIVYFMAVFYLAAEDLIPTTASLAIGPWTFALVVMALIGGAMIGVTGYRWAIWLGWSFVVAATGLMVLLKPATATRICIPIGLMSGMAMGLLSPALAAAVTAARTENERLDALSLHSFFSSLGQTLGIAVGSAVLLNQLKASMDANSLLAGDASVYIQDAVAMINVIKASPVQQIDLHEALTTAYTDALRWVWVTMCIFASITFVLSIWFTEGQRRGAASDEEQVR